MEVACTITAQSPQSHTISKTACSACRSQKIRCSRDKPACSRCLRRRLPCTFPEPPSRKRYSSLRETRIRSVSKERQIYSSRESEASYDNDYLQMRDSGSKEPMLFPSSPFRSSSRRGPVIGLQKEYWSVVNTYSPYTLLSSPQLRGKLPEFEIGLLLIEVYFSRVWTASLLFDYRSIVEGYRAATVPEHILFSIFAVASLLFRSPPSGSSGRENGLAAFGSVHELGRTWAETGSQLVLMSVDTPSISNIQACEVLCLYWFAVGQLDRTAMHYSISRESCRILQPKSDRMESHGGPNGPRYSQIPQRLSWACSIKSCIMETESEPAPLERAEIPGNLPPPLPQPGITDWFTCEEANFQSMAPYVVTLFKFWKRIKFFVRNPSTSNTSAFLAVFFDMDAKLQQFYESLPSQFNNTESLSSDSEKLQRNVFFLRSIYYLCVMCLHSSAVPALSCSEMDFIIPQEIAKLSAKRVHSTARHFVEMSRNYLATTPDFTKVPSFVGYCAFVAGSVQECVLELQGLGQVYDLPEDVEICMIILKELTVYWPVLSCFGRDLERRFQRFNPRLRFPFEAAAQGLLDGNHQLSIVDGDHPTLPAFINGSLNTQSQLNTSFILREYNDPNAFRQEEEDAEESCPADVVTDAGEGPPQRNETYATTNQDEVEKVPNSESPSTEEIHRADYHFEIPLADPSLESPCQNNNLAHSTVSTDSSNGEVTSMDISCENIWGFMDLFPDDMGNLFAGQPADKI